ncbi:hypothetical protein BDF19DRAFT_231575 [Syncephalis fuscata]|nr:hypothetical protein BDF19DRAFT_231575 [Syncephalis fuscata]
MDQPIKTESVKTESIKTEPKENNEEHIDAIEALKLSESDTNEPTVSPNRFEYIRKEFCPDKDASFLRVHVKRKRLSHFIKQIVETTKTNQSAIKESGNDRNGSNNHTMLNSNTNSRGHHHPHHLMINNTNSRNHHHITTNNSTSNHPISIHNDDHAAIDDTLISGDNMDDKPKRRRRARKWRDRRDAQAVQSLPIDEQGKVIIPVTVGRGVDAVTIENLGNIINVNIYNY